MTTSAGSPMSVTIRPLKSPARAPTTETAATIASSVLPVACHTQTKPTMPSAMIDGNDRSMSPATMSSVSIIATIAK